MWPRTPPPTMTDLTGAQLIARPSRQEAASGALEHLPGPHSRADPLGVSENVQLRGARFTCSPLHPAPARP